MQFRAALLFPILAFSALAAEPRLAPATARSLQREALMIMEYLDGYHYANRPFSDLEPKEVLDHHLEVLDVGRRVLLADDVNFLHRRFDRNLKTVYLFKGDLNPAFEISDLFMRRLRERAAWIRKLDYATLGERPQQIQTVASTDKPAWAESEEQLGARWVSQLWTELSWEYVEGHSEEEALETVKRRHSDYFDSLLKVTPERIRAFFLNSVMESFDPHTGYFSRELARDFDNAMRSSSEGMGINLYEDKGRLRLSLHMPSSPADLQAGLQPGDELVAVGTEANAPRPDLPLTRDSALAALSCAPGEARWLRLRGRIDGEERVVKLTSARFEHSDNRCEARLVRRPGAEHPIGYLRIPAFYGGDTGDLRADVFELLARLTSEGAVGLVMDLRDNGGGLLHEAASVAGMFLHGGPVLQAKGPGQGPAVFTDEDPAAVFEGPLVILINSGSASASEALSGTLQQLGVAVVVGSGPSFGKGSSQDYVDMRQLAGGALSPLQDHWGVMRVTRQLFYYATGQSPQLKGVSPDILIPGTKEAETRTERSMAHPIPSEEIPALGAGRDPKATVTPELLARLRAASEERVRSLPEFGFAESYQKLRLPGEVISAKLSAADLGRERVERAVRRSQLRKDWQAGDGKGWTYKRLVPDSVAAVEQAHDRALREIIQPDGRVRAEHLQGFVISTASSADGLQREEFVGRLDFDCAMAELPALVALWNQAAGDELDAETLRRLLDALRQHASAPEEVFKPFPVCRKFLSAKLQDAQIQAGLDALLCEVARLGRRAYATLATMDPQLREAVRITQDWADGK